jgi:predicted nucleic acid-binding protein
MRAQARWAPNAVGRRSMISPIFRSRAIPQEPFLFRIWELRHNVTAYDAPYLALAEALAAPLVTCDAKLASAAGHQARIELL